MHRPRTSSPPRAHVVAATLAAFAVLLATACGGDDDTDSGAAAAANTAAANTTAANTTAAAGDTIEPTASTGSPGTDETATTARAGEAVVIEHAFGTTTIDGVPQRIVSLGSQWTDALLAMGTQPVGHLADSLAGDDGVYPWEQDLSADSVAIEVTDSLPFEQIAALEPDLILVTYLAEDKAAYDDLAAIAPTIGVLGERQVDLWQDQIEVVGRFMHEPERAGEVIDGVEQLMAETAEEYPGLAGKTFALANYVPGDALYVVADPEDGSTLFFESLGMELDPEILDVADGVSGRAELSIEQAGLLDSDLLVLFSNDGDPRDLVGYEQLPAVRDGAVSEIEYEPVVGLNTPSALSIPYSLEVVRPALEAAADG